MIGLKHKNFIKTENSFPRVYPAAKLFTDLYKLILYKTLLYGGAHAVT
jgi:hypothetical protein